MSRQVFVTAEGYEAAILKYRKRAYEYLDELDGYLQQGDMAGVEAFVAIFQEEQFRKHYIPSLDLLAYGCILAAITVDERNAGKETLFLQNGKTIKELTRFLKQIEFLLWEMEFQIVPEAEQNLIDFLERYQVSAEALKGIILVAGINKKRCFMTISCSYMEHQKLNEAFKILLYGLEIFPGDADILTMLMQLCQSLGLNELAEGYKERLLCIGQSV